MYSDPSLARRRLTPLGISDILDEAFRLLRENFLLLAGIVALIQVPLTILSTLITNNIIPDLTTNLQRISDAVKDVQNNTAIDSSRISQPLNHVIQDGAELIAVAVVLFVIGTGVISAALTIAISERFVDRPASIARCYAIVLDRLVPLLGSLLVFSLLLLAILFVPAGLVAVAGSASLAVVLFMLSLIAFVYVAVRLTFTVQAVALEGHRLSSLKRSWRLTSGFWWKTLGVLVLTNVLVALLQRFVGVIDTHLFAGVPAVGTAIDTLLTIITRPLVLGAQTLLFFDLKVRKEGFDLEAMVTSLEALERPHQGL